MADVQIKLAGLWAALMLTYLLGDVLRIFSGDFKAGEIGGQAHSTIFSTSSNFKLMTWLAESRPMVMP